MVRGDFRGSRGGGDRGGRGRGGFGGRGGRGGFGGGRGNFKVYLIGLIGFDQGPPEYVEAVAEFSHACEGMLICNIIGDRVPLLMRLTYL